MSTQSVRQESRRPVEASYVGSAVVLRHVRRVGFVLALAVWTVPILTPSGPMNMALPDVTIGVAVVMTVLLLRRTGAKVSLPYSVGMGIFMLAGAIAAFHHEVVSAALPLMPDLLMLLWAAAIANAVQWTWLLRVFLQAWCWSAIAGAAAMLIGVVAGVNALAGINPKNGGRAALTMIDPNMAGNYFMCALMVLLATSAIRSGWIRFFGAILIILAIGLTGSNGALVGVGIALVVGGTVHVYKARGPVFALAVAGLGLALAGVAGPHIDVAAIQQQAADSIQPLHDSLGRSDASGSERKVLVSEGVRLFRAGDLLGIGPGRTKQTLANQGASYVKEAHDDYVATLVERGVLGGVGLIILISAAGVRLTRVTFRRLPAEVAALVPRPEYLLGLGFALLTAGFFYEILHFRQLWAFLGLVAGLDMMVRRPWPR
jgi:O-antigen ligase